MSEESVRAACCTAVVCRLDAEERIVPHEVVDLTTGTSLWVWAHNSDTAYPCPEEYGLYGWRNVGSSWVVLGGYSGQSKRGCFASHAEAT